MVGLFRLAIFLAAITHTLSAYAAAVSQKKIESPWLTLPPTPKLPGNPAGTKTTINGVKIWHATFGTRDAFKPPVLLLHHGLGNSDYWGDVVKLVMKNRYVIVMDTRAHGRSVYNKMTPFSLWDPEVEPFSFEGFARDAAALLKSLHIKKAVWVGWSEGANTVLAALMDRKLASMVDRAFIYGAWHHVAFYDDTYAQTSIYNEFKSRATTEYKAFQPDSNFGRLFVKWNVLTKSRPLWERDDLAKIKIGSKLMLSWGEHEEAVNLDEMNILPDYIKGSQQMVLPVVSRFGPLQNATQFAHALESFLK